MKVLIGCPTSDIYEYCLNDYLNKVKELTFNGADLLIVDNSKEDKYFKKLKSLGINAIKADFLEDLRERIVASRNILRNYALDNGYDYFLSLEQDVIPPKDIIQRLLRHNKDIVTGVYYKIYNLKITNPNNPAQPARLNKIFMPVLFRFSDEPGKMHICLPKHVEGDNFFKVRASGLGCLLISHKVLKKIEFRAEKGSEAFDDVLFCDDAYRNGFEVFVDTSVKCKHMITKKGKIIDNLRPVATQSL